LKRIEYVCQTCTVPFTLWWTEKEDPKVFCPVCRSTNVKREGEYDYGRKRVR
jgi:DNA-directed RNA polymerase subunit RPC12/RpoP